MTIEGSCISEAEQRSRQGLEIKSHFFQLLRKASPRLIEFLRSCHSRPYSGRFLYSLTKTKTISHIKQKQDYNIKKSPGAYRHLKSSIQPSPGPCLFSPRLISSNTSKNERHPLSRRSKRFHLPGRRLHKTHRNPARQTTIRLQRTRNILQHRRTLPIRPSSRPNIPDRLSCLLGVRHFCGGCACESAESCGGVEGT